MKYWMLLTLMIMVVVALIFVAHYIQLMCGHTPLTYCVMEIYD